jgi:hypothetical protein
MRPIHLQRVAMSDTSGVILTRLLPSNPERIFRIKIQDAMIFHIHLRHAIVCRRKQEAGIKTKFERSWLEITIPVRPLFPTETEVPFSDHSGAIPDSTEASKQS